MSKFLNILSNVLLIIVTTFLMSSISFKEVELQQELDKIKNETHLMQEELTTNTCEKDSLLNLIEILKSPAYLNLRYGAEQFLTKRVRKKGRIPGTCVHVVPYIRDTRIHSDLHEALLELNVPVLSTSLKRGSYSFGNSKSKHRIGKAMDLALNKEGYEFLDWIITDEGIVWREKYGVTVYIESKKYALKNNLKREFRQFFLRNKYATGNHIHLEIS